MSHCREQIAFSSSTFAPYIGMTVATGTYDEELDDVTPVEEGETVEALQHEIRCTDEESYNFLSSSDVSSTDDEN